MMKFPAFPLCPAQDMNHHFVQGIPTDSHLRAQLSNWPSWYRSAGVHVTFILLNNGPKMQEEWWWQFRAAKEKPKSASLKWKGKSSRLNRERKKPHAEDANKIYGKNKFSLQEIEKKERILHARFAAALKTAKVTTTVSAKCLAKMEKALYLNKKIFWKRSHSHNFHHSILVIIVLLSHVVVNLFLCLIWKVSPADKGGFLYFSPFSTYTTMAKIQKTDKIKDWQRYGRIGPYIAALFIIAGKK